MNYVSDQKEQGQQNHRLSSLLQLQSRTESSSSADNSPIHRLRESNSSQHSSLDSLNPSPEVQKAPTQQKPVNLLPAVPIHTFLTFSEREKRYCDVIGKNKCYCIFLCITSTRDTDFSSSLITFIVRRETYKIILLYRTKVHSGQCTKGCYAFPSQLRKR